MLFQILFLIFVLILLIWYLSLMVSVISGAPTVYAKREIIEKAFELAQIKPGQTVLDLGCGNGRSLIIATKKFGTRGVGVEISPFYYMLARFNVWRAGESKNIKIVYGNLLNQDKLIKQSDVIYLYLFENLLDRLKPIIYKNAKKGTKIISIGFKLKNTKSYFSNKNPKLYLYRI